MKEKEQIKEQLNLSLPSAFDYIIITLISMVDVFAISCLGSRVVAAVGAMTSVIFFYNLGIKAIQVANNVLIAREIGKNDLAKMRNITGNSLLLAIGFQIICIILIAILAPLFPSLFKVDAICLTYLYIRLIGSVPEAFTLIIIGHERTNGRSKQMLYVRIVALVLNIILDYLAIRLDYGIAGVAWATVIIGFINMLLVMLSVKKTIDYKYNKMIIRDIMNLVKHGILDRIFDRGGKLFLDIILSRLGTFEYAAHVILNQIEAFANDFCYGFCIGITTNMGIELGKKENNMLALKRIIDKIIRVLSFITPVIIGIVSLWLLPMLLKESEALEIAYRLLPLVVIYAIFIPLRYKYSSIIEGLQMFKFNAQVSFIINIIKIGLAFILVKLIGVAGVWGTFIITHIILISILKYKIKQTRTFS